MQRLHTSRDFGRVEVKQHVEDVYQHAPTTEPTPGESEPDIISKLVELPGAVWAMHNELHGIYEQVMLGSAARPWAPLATLSNLLGTTLGAGCWAAAIVGVTRDIGIELRDIVVGTDAAQVVQLLAVPNSVLDATVPTRLLGTIRTTANGLTAWFPGRVTLRVGESLILSCSAAPTVHFDFSCSYRLLRS